MTTASLTFDLSTPVGDIVAASPGLGRVFARAGIDFCCGGRRPLAEACRARGLEGPAFLLVLRAAAEGDAAAPAVDPAGMGLAELADHIEATHHRRLRDELPVLIAQAERVAARHGERDPRLVAVAEAVHGLAAEMSSHLAKEEQVLFPLIRRLEREGRVPAEFGSGLARPIACMEAEHADAGSALAKLRELTGDFAIPADACNTHRALLAGLAWLERDLHEHVHKENNVLFPRALAREAETAA